MNASLLNVTAWSLRTASKDDLIYLFACLPISVLGIFFCASSAYVLWSSEFKESLYKYLRIECILMTLDLIIISFRSLAPVFMCRTVLKANCPLPTSSFPVLIDVIIFFYLPSPTEATALVADIFSAINCMILLSSRTHNRLENFILELNPFITVLLTYLLFSLMFIYQCFTNVYIFHSDFIISNRIYFDIIAFSIRDGLFLTVLLVLYGIINFKVKSSLKKKMSIVSAAKKKTKKSQHKMSIMVLATCLNSAIGRIPILCLFVILNVNQSLTVLYPLKSTLSFAVLLSYFLKFFIYMKFNKRFRLVAFQKLTFLKLFCEDIDVDNEHLHNSFFKVIVPN